MSSSTVGGGRDVGEEEFDLRYSYKPCFCEKKAVVKIVESNKPSKGRLYYNCKKRSCRFFAWCHPISIVPLIAQPEGYGTRYRNTETNVELNKLAARVKSIEDTLKCMKKMMAVVVVILVSKLLVGMK